MPLKTVKVPKEFEPLFEKAESVVSIYFGKKSEDPTHGTIEIFDSRYVLVRGAALSVEFFQLSEEIFGKGRQDEAHQFARNILYDLAHSIGRADARNFHTKMNLREPVDRLSAGPIHFSHTGWAFVDIFPESTPTPDENYLLLYDHPYSFESDAWNHVGKKADFPVCIMNAGYSAGWCEESFGVELVATEILCKAKGDDVCRFIMAPPKRIEEHIRRYAERMPELSERIKAAEIPDLFARKRFEENLKNAAKKFRTIYDGSSDLIFIRDLDGKFIDVNQVAIEKLGYSRKELIGKDLGEIAPDDETGRITERLEEVKSRGTASFEMESRSKSGGSISLEFRSRMIDYGEGDLILSVARDITERKDAESEIKQKTYELGERMKELRCLYNVSKLIEDTALSFDEIIQYTVGLIPPALQVPEIAGAKIEIAGREYASKNFTPSRCMYSRDIAANGGRIGRIEVSYSLDKVAEEHGCFLREEEEMIDTIAEQIGHMKERLDSAEKIHNQTTELEEKNRKLREFDQKKSEFVSAVAHELRGPLATIRGGISLVLEGIHGPLNENQAKTLTISKNNIDRLVRIVNNLLDLSKMEAGKIEMHISSVDVKAWLTQLVQSNENAFKEKGLELKLDLPDESLVMEADGDLLTQLFTNLIGNAKKFTESGFVEVGAKDAGVEIRFWIKDTGMGMVQDDLPKIFDKFQQVGLKDGGGEKGTGLGLSIVKGILELHGGKIEVESELGKGSIFWVTIPKSQPERSAE